MSVVLDFRPQSMASARWFGVAQARFAQAAARLGTGLRVNSGADDAAGLKLSSRIDGQVSGWHQAQRNIQEGLSLAQVIDGSFAELADIVGRIRELAIQSANGVYSDAERRAIQDEVVILRGEISNVIAGTKFNGISAMEGSVYRPPPTIDPTGALNGTVTFDGVTLTGGSVPNPALAGGVAGPNNAYGTANTQSGTYEVVILAAPNPAQALAFGSPVAPLPAGAGVAVQINLTGPLGSATIDLNYGTGPAAWVAAVNAETVNTGVQASLFAVGADNYLLLETTGGGGAQRLTVSATTLDPMIQPEDYIGFGPGVISANGVNLIATINGALATAGGSVTQTTLRLNSPGNAADGLTVTIPSPLPGVYTAGPFPASAGWVNVQGFASEIQSLVLDIHSGPNSPDHQALTVKPMTTGAMAMTGAGTIGTIDLSTQAGALDAVGVADAAVAQIVDARAQLASDMASLDHGLAHAGSGEDNQAAAGSRIVDADVAAESVELIGSQLQRDLAATASSYIHADAARTLQLITDSRVGVLLQPQAPPDGGGAPTASASGGVTISGGSTSIDSAASLVGAPAGATAFSGGSGFAPAPVLPSGFSPIAATPGFAPQAATPGYQPLPVLGSSGLGGGQGLSSGEMLSMIAGGLA